MQHCRTSRDTNFKNILFLGNTNSMPFRHALTLKKQGHNVIIFIDAKANEKLHRPEFLFEEIFYPYPSWIKELAWRPRGVDFIHPHGDLAKLINYINNESWDGIVLCGGWLKIAPHLNTNANIIALLAGSDLDVLASYEQALRPQFPDQPFKNILTKFAQIIGTYLQRRGIRKCSLINYYPRGVNVAGDKLLDQVMRGINFERLHFRGCDVESVAWVEPSTRIGADVRLFSPTRFIWKEPLPTGYTPEENKGNDVMLRGIAEFYQKTKISIKVDLVEKGPHIQESKALAQYLGIEKLITWHKEMSPIEIMEWYKNSDIIFDQFGNHWLGTGAVDSMLIGRPVIGKSRNDVFIDVIGKPSPMCDANYPLEIAQWLYILVNDWEKRRTIGIESRIFMKEHLDAKKTAAALLNHIANWQKPQRNSN